jgi:hypothetical protein
MGKSGYSKRRGRCRDEPQGKLVRISVDRLLAWLLVQGTKACILHRLIWGVYDDVRNSKTKKIHRKFLGLAKKHG